MDILTHLAIGTCLGEAFAGKKMGKKALAWGAIVHSLPDIDVLSALWLPVPAALLAHRGFTHSLAFCALAAPVLSVVARRTSPLTTLRYSTWLCFFGAAILLHDGLDALTNYGVAWFEPFNGQRVSLNMIYIIDPFFMIWPAAAALALIFLRKFHPRRIFWKRAGLGISSLYIVYCCGNKFYIDQTVRTAMKNQQISYNRYFTTPAPLQNWLWYIVAGTDSGYFTAYHSVFARRQRLEMRYFARNSKLLKQAKDQDAVENLVRFSQQFYIVTLRQDSIIFNDLRFGQIIGWQRPGAPFAFYYFIDYPEQNRFIVQRGRLTGWSWPAVKSLYSRAFDK